MEELIKNIESSISIEEHDKWKSVSLSWIESGKISPLSILGLYQVIDLLGWHIATDITNRILGHYSDAEWENFIDDRALKIDDIQATASLGSGTHPAIVFQATAERAEYYVDLFNQMRVA